MPSLFGQLSCLPCLSRPGTPSSDDTNEKQSYTRIVEISERQEVRIATTPTPATRATPTPLHFNYEKEVQERYQDSLKNGSSSPSPEPNAEPYKSSRIHRLPPALESATDSKAVPQKRLRIAVACGQCRKRLIKCGGSSSDGTPCSNCTNFGQRCGLTSRTETQPENPFLDPSNPERESSSTSDEQGEPSGSEPQPSTDLDPPEVHEKLHFYRRSVLREEEQGVMGDGWRSVKASLNPKPDIVRPPSYPSTPYTYTSGPPSAPRHRRRGILRKDGEQAVLGDGWRSVKASLTPKPDIIRPATATAPQR